MSRLQWKTPQDALRSLLEDDDSDFESSALFIKHKPTEKTQEFMAQGVSSVFQPVSFFYYVKLNTLLYCIAHILLWYCTDAY